MPDGALSWKKMVFPLPDAVDDGMLTSYESPFVESVANWADVPATGMVSTSKHDNGPAKQATYPKPQGRRFADSASLGG